MNPHVYSDTVFFLGNFSKGFLIEQKYYFGIGASIASISFFFLLGFLSQYFSKYLQNEKSLENNKFYYYLFYVFSYFFGIG